jgi:hypothetical protein
MKAERQRRDKKERDRERGFQDNSPHGQLGP